MKARDVSVSVVQYADEIFVQVTLKLPGHLLERELACPDPPACNGGVPAGTRVKESSRRAVAKEIRKVLEGVEFPDA